MTFKVTINPAGHTIEVNDGETVLEAALRSGHVIPYSCRGGTCGSCLGKVCEGSVDYPDGRPLALSEQEQAEGKALFCQARPSSDLVIEAREIDAANDVQIRIMPCRIMQLEKLAPDVMKLSLKLPANERLQFLAGQYIDFLLRDGRRRSFSLANAPHNDDFLELHVRLVPDGEFTGHIFNNVKEKAIMRFQGPLGTFFLREDSQTPVIMMGGGTGFAPLKGMLEDMFHKGIERPVHLYWGARAQQDLYLNSLPTQWAERYPQLSYIPVLSEPDSDEPWTGRTGFVHQAVADDFPDLSGHEVYMSGPPPMINAAKRAFFDQGLTQDRLFYDSFDFAPDSQA
jgi:CDP-4-dehydro-6-deoxyglucose reductase